MTKEKLWEEVWLLQEENRKLKLKIKKEKKDEMQRQM